MVGPVELFVIAFGSALLEAVLTVARRAILIALVTSIFVLVSATLLALSAAVLTGWWQNFTLELGVGLLVAGIVDIAVLGALHGLIEGGENIEVEVTRAKDAITTAKEAKEQANERLAKIVREHFGLEFDDGHATHRPSGTGWPS